LIVRNIDFITTRHDVEIGNAEELIQKTSSKFLL